MLNKTILDCGLVIISEYIPAFPSFAMSYTLKSASREENVQNNGIYHFIEHMIFKGSKKYDMKKIADLSDRLGGQINAFTGKEVTQYYIKAIDEKLNESFDLLTDMVLNATFPEDEFLKERNVLLQEINESEDNPDTHAFEIFYEELYKDNGLGLPIAGKEDVVGAFERDMVFDFYKQSYTPNNLILAVVGNVKHEELVTMAEKAFKDFPSAKPREYVYPGPEFLRKTFTHKNKYLKQVYAITALKGISSISPHRHQFLIMNDILGGGMSSRLYQEIREEKGLAYTVNVFTDSYLDTGLHIIYSIIEKSKIDEYLEAIKLQCERIMQEGITEDELNRSRDHIKASVILGMESSITRMRFHINNELGLKREITVQEMVNDIDGATVTDINKLCREFLDLNESASFLYGNVGKKRLKI